MVPCESRHHRSRASAGVVAADVEPAATDRERSATCPTKLLAAAWHTKTPEVQRARPATTTGKGAARVSRTPTQETPTAPSTALADPNLWIQFPEAGVTTKPSRYTKKIIPCCVGPREYGAAARWNVR